VGWGFRAMASADEPTARRPPKRRAPWSLRSIVIEVTGKPITEFQEAPPARSRVPVARAVGVPAEEEELADPVAHFSPPLSGARGRAAHGPRLEHDAATLEHHRTVPDANDPLRSTPPEHPERLYLHYLLLHLDRLSLPSLWYLRRQVNDEIANRARPPPAAPPAAE